MTDRPATARTVPRREAILSAATELFRRRGYHAVGVHDIGVAAGVTGPALYRHFPSKQALLVALFERALGKLVDRAEQVIGESGDARATLEALVRVHVAWVLDDRELVAVYDQEQFNLPDEARRRLRRAQRLYIEEWVHLLCELRPDLTDAQARAAVHAAMGVMHSTTKYASGLPREELRQLLERMALGALDAARPGPSQATAVGAGEGTPATVQDAPGAAEKPRAPAARRRKAG